MVKAKALKEFRLHGKQITPGDTLNLTEKQASVYGNVGFVELTPTGEAKVQKQLDKVAETSAAEAEAEKKAPAKEPKK